MNKQFRDSDGNDVTLETLCRREPEWAASRIRKMNADIPDAALGAAVRAMIAEAGAGPLKCAKCGSDDWSGSCQCWMELHGFDQWNARQIVARIRKMIDNERNER